MVNWIAPTLMAMSRASQLLPIWTTQTIPLELEIPAYRLRM
jgi:hypothetical protein